MSMRRSDATTRIVPGGLNKDRPTSGEAERIRTIEEVIGLDASDAVIFGQSRHRHTDVLEAIVKRATLRPQGGNGQGSA